MHKKGTIVNKTIALAALVAGSILLQGCDSGSKVEEEGVIAPVAEPNVVEIRAVGMTFEGSSEIPSGWTTFRFVNASSMIHFALIDVPPEGISAQEFTDTVGQPFQEAMDGMNAGDEEAVNAAFAKFPAWIGDLKRSGGPGFLSPGLISETTVYMEPGVYAFECYVKTNGIFHTTSPGEGQLGMMLEFTVTDEKTDAPEPTANVTVAVKNSGMEIASGALQTGMNSIRVDFVEQQALPSFVGNDIHIMKVDNAESISVAGEWLDWRNKDGLEDPSPVVFLGGINDMPAGSHSYMTVDLGPGDYAFIAEVPEPEELGLVLPFTIK
jgi:hypothetical protein